MAYIIYPNIEAITSDMLANSNICSEFFNNCKSMDEIINEFAYSKILERDGMADNYELSKIFLEWAKDIFFHEKFTESLINYVVDENSFDEINLKVCNSFRAYTESNSSIILNIYSVRIIINLLFREIVLLDYLKGEAREKIIGYLHVPLDRSVLMAIRLILNRKEFDHNLGVIPQSVGENFIDSYIKYYSMQKFFNDIASSTDVPPVYYYNLIKYKEKITCRNDEITENNDPGIQNDEENEDKIFNEDEFINSRIFNQYSSIVREIINTLLGKIKGKNLDTVIINRKKFILVNSKANPEINILKVWINNYSVHIEVTKQDIKKYTSPEEIGDSLIKKIEEKYLSIE